MEFFKNAGSTKTEVFEYDDIILNTAHSLRGLTDEYECYRNSIVLAFPCGRAKTIRVRYVKTRIFSKTENKISSVFNNIRIRVDGAHFVSAYLHSHSRCKKCFYHRVTKETVVVPGALLGPEISVAFSSRKFHRCCTGKSVKAWMKSDVIQETQQRVCHPLSLPAPEAVTQIEEYEWSIVYLRNSRANARENHEKRWHAKGNLSTQVVIFARARIFPSPRIQYLRKKKDYWCSEP